MKVDESPPTDRDEDRDGKKLTYQDLETKGPKERRTRRKTHTVTKNSKANQKIKAREKLALFFFFFDALPSYSTFSSTTFSSSPHPSSFAGKKEEETTRERLKRAKPRRSQTNKGKYIW
jgi:hypothetical protein